MPLYEYQCPACGYKTEACLSYEEGKTKVFICVCCQRVMVRRLGNIAYFEFKEKL